MDKQPFGEFEKQKIQCLKDINETLKVIIKEMQIKRGAHAKFD